MSEDQPALDKTSSPNTPGRRRLKHAAFTLILSLGLPLLVLALIEGASSGILFIRDALRSLRTSEQLTGGVQYDSLLGWVGRPNTYMPDLWGRGVHYRTNSRGFRSNSELAAHAPTGRVRIICSGDSFTQGAGVDNDHTWCELLARRHETFETVNLGLGGYGFDQAYLRFKRDGNALQHDLHILAFITDDFRRMQYTKMGSAGKPRLVLHNGVLSTENVPVPRPEANLPKLRHILGSVQQLRTVQLLQRVLAKVPRGATEAGIPDSNNASVVSAIIAELSAMGRMNRTYQVLLYLPTLDDYLGGDADRWRERVRTAVAQKPNVWYLDLVPVLRRLPHDTVTLFFIPYQPTKSEGIAHGHYTNAGNRWVADQVFSFLLEVPEIAGRLKQVASGF